MNTDHEVLRTSFSSLSSEFKIQPVFKVVGSGTGNWLSGHIEGLN